VLLAGALDALLSQEAAPAHEIIIVDNASSDDTASVIAALTSRHSHVRCIVESRQGLAFARNTGIAAAAAPIVAFTDDDVRVGPGWVKAVASTFEQHADTSCAGGPVLPLWPARVPEWLTERHWAPLGVQDYGPLPLRIDARRPLCLIGANLAFRREALEALGGFDPAVQRVGGGIGSTEDQEYHLRLWQSGRHGIYDPALAVNAIVEPARVRKRHHRAWHFGHGRHVARMRLPEIEASRARLLGVPGHLVRQAVVDARDYATGLLRLDAAAAFEREVRLWFAAGFIRERLG
jgi:glycosyltransferase involved in cell wall biosynthesis